MRIVMQVPGLVRVEEFSRRPMQAAGKYADWFSMLKCVAVVTPSLGYFVSVMETELDPEA